MKNFPVRRGASGFTLVELLVTLALLAILTAMAVPSMRDLIQRNRVAAYSNELITTLALARNEAIRRGQSATLAGISPDRDLTGGWRVTTFSFADPAAALILQEHEALTNVDFCTACTDKQGNGVSDAVGEPKSIEFNASGHLSKVNGAAVKTTASLILIPGDCSSGKEVGRIIHISALGRVISEPAICP